MPSWNEMLSQVRTRVTEITPREVFDRQGIGHPAVILDVRERDEWEQGHLENATFIPRGLLEMKVEKAVADKTAPVIVYCAGGVRSAMAVSSLQDLGYQNVLSMQGGFNGWKEAGLPFKVEAAAKDNPLARYARHLNIPEVGEAGQRKLLASKVLMVGAGGLGSPAAFYLAAAGVGHLGLVDSDLVDETNLQRQILHKTRSVGMPKVQSAKETLFDLNPQVKVEAYNMRLDQHNAEALIREYDLVVDGSDNFNTRYLVNDLCVKHDKPNIYASVFRFDGQATVFLPHQGPCYRCLYPEPTPAELAPNCQEAGVLGVLPGLLGLIQATEAIKVLLHIGTPLAGRLLTCDALEGRFREYKVPRDPECEACGPDANIQALLERAPIPAACAAPAATGPVAPMHRVLFFSGTGYSISSFGFMVGLGILLGAYINHRRRHLAGLDGSGIQDALVCAILGGFVGARLLFVLLNLSWYMAHPADLINTREGGISWYGALAGGVLGLALFCRWRKVSWPAVLDIFAPSLLAAHALGRVGCLLNGCCYGKVSKVPWAVMLTEADHPINLFPRHPVQLYESAMDLVALALLLYVEKRYDLRQGRVFLAFLGLYGMVRFIAEFYRDGDILWLGLTLAQLSSLAIVALALVLLSRGGRVSPAADALPTAR